MLTKKMHYPLWVGTTMLCLLLAPLAQEEKSAFNVSPKTINILVKFKKGTISPVDYCHDMENIYSPYLLDLFKEFGIASMKAVFKNRYDEKGKLKTNLSLSNPHHLEGWQEITFGSEPHAEQFIAELKTFHQVELAMIEEPMELEPAIVPNDPQYSGGGQWHLNAAASYLDVDQYKITKHVNFAELNWNKA